MDKESKINNQIKSSTVSLILNNGKMKGVVPISEALQIADDAGLDLVQVSKPCDKGIPICKLLDYGKIKYQFSKKRKHQTTNRMKEMRCNFNISEHDLSTKHRKILNFLDRHYRVKYVMELKGREKSLIKTAIDKINANLAEFSSIASWKTPTVSEAKNRIRLTTMLDPTKQIEK